MKWVRVFVLDQDVSHGAEESGGARYGSFQLARHRDTSSPKRCGSAALRGRTRRRL